MRFEIRINQGLEDQEPVLVVLLFTKKDEEYLNGCEEGIYNCASTMPKDTRELISIIENGVNACMQTYEKEMEQVIKDIIEKNRPKIDQK